MMEGELIPAAHLPLEPVHWLVEGMIPETGIGIWYAPSGTHKSFVALALAMAAGNGHPFLGHATAGGQVVYMMGEGQSDFPFRKEALVRYSAGTEHPLSEKNLWMVMKPWHLADKAAVQAWIARLSELDNLRYVVIDTLSRFAGASVTYPKPAGDIMENLAWMSRELSTPERGVFIMCIHHTMADGKRMKGSQTLFDMADVVIRQQAGMILAEKVKAGPLFAPVPYMMKGFEYQEWDPRLEDFTTVSTLFMDAGMTRRGRQAEADEAAGRLMVIRNARAEFAELRRQLPGMPLGELQGRLGWSDAKIALLTGGQPPVITGTAEAASPGEASPGNREPAASLAS
jgi:AAA domain